MFCKQTNYAATENVKCTNDVHDAWYGLKLVVHAKRVVSGDANH